MGLLDSDLIVGALNAGEQNHKVIANNLANLNTPGFRSSRVRFAQQLEEVLDSQGKLKPGCTMETETYTPRYSDAGVDGNDVSLAREIAELNDNVLRMKTYLAVLDANIRKMRSAMQIR